MPLASIDPAAAKAAFELAQTNILKSRLRLRSVKPRAKPLVFRVADAIRTIVEEGNGAGGGTLEDIARLFPGERITEQLVIEARSLACIGSVRLVDA